jgi:hypothetical protein
MKFTSKELKDVREYLYFSEKSELSAYSNFSQHISRKEKFIHGQKMLL